MTTVVVAEGRATGSEQHKESKAGRVGRESPRRVSACRVTSRSSWMATVGGEHRMRIGRITDSGDSGGGGGIKYASHRCLFSVLRMYDTLTVCCELTVIRARFAVACAFTSAATAICNGVGDRENGESVLLFVGSHPSGCGGPACREG